MPLRVLVDAVSARVGGGGTYIVSQMEALAAEDGIALTILASGSVADRLRAACPSATIVVVAALPAPLRIVWEQAMLPFTARRFDAVYMPGNFALLLSPRPQVLTVQNAWYFTDPVRRFRREHCPLRMRVRLNVETALARASIRRADCVVAVSRAMLEAIEADLGPLARAKTIASAVPGLPEPSDGEVASIVRPYALVVAHDDPHKEWSRLIDIFLAHRDLPRLVIAGRTSPQRADALREHIARRAPGRVELLGTVSEPSVLSALYRHAACCVAHARFESFGFTASEGLSQGTPVAAADIPAHRETCGSAALYYDCEDGEALAQAVRVAARQPRAEEMRLQRTWRDNARELAQTLREVADKRAPVAA